MTEEVTQPVPPEPVRGPSIVLSEAREKLGLSQKDVADKLFLTTTFIKYIDDGEFDRIPKPAFIKGYLRTYARVVDLSGDLIVELYEKELEAVEPTLEMKGVTDEKVGTASITGPVLQTGLIGLALLIAVIAGIWWLVADTEEEPLPRAVSVVPQDDEVTKSPEAFEYVIDGPGEELPSVSDAETGSAQLQFDEEGAEGLISSTDAAEIVTEAVEAVTEAEPEEIEVTEAATVAEEPPAVTFERNRDGGRDYITVDAGGFDELELTFADECWVEITDGEQGLVYNDLNRGGDVLKVFGALPYKVLLGKATGVEMIYNGRPFDLEPYIAQDQTAKLTIND